MLMWAVAVGSIIGTFPFNSLYNHFGARYVFFTAGIVSAMATIMIPTAASWGFGYFLAFRFIQGLVYSADFAALGVICVRWASLKQSAIFISILTCFSPFSVAITNPVSGFLCESKWGWPSVYYSHGIACLIVFILWIISYTDEPATHKAVSGIELEKIHRGKTEAHKTRDSYVPYWQICKNPVILAVWLNSLTDLVSGIFLLTYTPTYLKSVLHYDVEHTGWLGALPGVSHIPIKLFCGFLSDGIKTVSERKKLMIFNSIALIVPAIMYIGLGFVPKEYPIVAVALFTGINGFIGANCGGFYKCGILVSRQ
uniref:Major facilitator superfamily (MFS) profile domain-containing protein n=1 Tax=Panagrolaimus sp. JU765 TaxID=591449 RepID=A0AC34RMG2_9BILA